MPEFSSIPDMITECFELDVSRESQWYKRYQKTHQQVLNAPTSDEVLELLWYVRDNSVASLKQGNTSRVEFNKAKEEFLELTQLIVSNPTAETYDLAVKKFVELKSNGMIGSFYGALLNRVFAAIAPDKVTSCVKDDAFTKAAAFINQHFNLGLSLNGNWFEKNLELKIALRKRLESSDKEFDDFKINIAVWVVFALIVRDKEGPDQKRIQDELKAQSIETIDLTVEQYKEVLRAENLVNESEINLLTTLYSLPESGANSRELSEYLGLDSGVEANFLLGKLSKKVARYFDIEQTDTRNKYMGRWQLIVNGKQFEERFLFQLNSNLRVALDQTELLQTPKQGHIDEPKIDEGERPPLNQVFYGPPGTGKTYFTTEAAVKAAIPGYVFQSRHKLKTDYDELVKNKRIQFVSFHQSYGYEEFVEGLRAVVEDGQVRYEVKPGVFKRLCTSASSNLSRAQQATGSGFDACWELFLEQFDDESSTTIQTKKSWFRVTEISETTIYFEKAQGESKHTLAISTLKEIFNQNRVLKGGLNVYYQPLIAHLKGLVESVGFQKESQKNYVLIIDEINRGNISKIFGELITLIEESKRSFSFTNESAVVTLPYSGDPFSVPKNLYIIGTMNTADRSLAMMDTALRRRFDFTEMMPQHELFSSLNIRGIDLGVLLETLNQRVEALYDRDHMLGHALFIPVKDALEGNHEVKAFELLKRVFINKLIPLLEEYFFDDWDKIRLILGEHKKPDHLQFIKVSIQSYDTLFGKGHKLDSYEQHSKFYHLAKRDADVWNNAEAYQYIYQTIDVS